MADFRRSLNLAFSATSYERYRNRLTRGEGDGEEGVMKQLENRWV